MNEPDRDPAAAARVGFHLALAGVLIPFLGWMAALGLALWLRLRADPGPEAATWRCRLWALVAADALVLACMAGLLYRPATPSPPPHSGARVGILFDERRTEAVVLETIPGSPAEKAGLRPCDLIEAVDGRAVATPPEVKAEIGRLNPGVARTLTVRREDAAIALIVVPVAGAAASKGDLFETASRTPKAPWGRLVADLLLPSGACFVGWLISRRASARPLPVWRWLGLFLFVSGGATLGVGWLLKAAWGGVSTKLVLLLLLAQTVSMLLCALAVGRWARPPTPILALARPLSATRATLLGIFYGVAGSIRLSVVLGAIDTFILGGKGMPPQSLDALGSAPGLGILGGALFVAAVAVLGPIAEELLFRGFLLPRLAATIRPAWALALSAAVFGLLHISYRHYVVVLIYYGLVLGWARLRTGGLAAPVLLHMTANLLSSIIILSR